MIEEPLSPEEWLESPYHSGQFAWELWDGVKQDVIDICKKRPKLTIITGGIGTGKTRTSEAVIQYEIYRLLCHGSVPMALGLPASATVLIALLSTKLQKAADTIYRRLSTNIRATEWFKDKARPNENLKRRLEWPSLIVAPLPSNVQSAISEDLYMAVLDEVNFWSGSTDADPVDKVAFAMQQRMRSRFKENFMMMQISSATTWDSYTERMKSKADKVISRTPWQARGEPVTDYFYVEIGDRNSPPRLVPKMDTPIRKAIKVPMSYHDEAKEDLFAFLRERVGIGVTESRRLYSSRIVHYPWEDNKNPEEILIEPGQEVPDLILKSSNELRIIHVDLALSKDWCGMACGFVVDVDWDESEEGVIEQLQRINIDFAIRLRPKNEMHELDLAFIRAIIYSIGKKAQIAKVTYDGFQSADSIQILKKKGIDAGRISVDRTPDPHNLLKRLFSEERIIVPYNSVLVNELRLLQVSDKNGKVDHPKRTETGELGSKDIADAVAGVAWSAHEMAAGIQVFHDPVELECLVF